MPQLAISDEYFNRSAAIVVDSPLYNRRVRYAVFAREGGVICGLNRACSWIEQQCVGPLLLRALCDGDPFEPNQAVLVIVGLFGELINLETTYLGMLAFSGAATQMSHIVAAAEGLPVIDMAARHYPYEIIEQTAYAAAVGGARGTSTRAGYRYVQRWLGIGQGEKIRLNHHEPYEYKLYGSIPHALNALYEGDSIESARAYHERFPVIPLTVLIDFEGRELDVAAEAVRGFGDDLHAVRLDTHGGRIHQGGHAKPVTDLIERILANAPDPTAAQWALEKYGFGPGVTIEAVFNVRRALDDAGGHKTKIIVTSGFTAEKTRAFRLCQAPMDGIGTGSWVTFTIFTSDITHVHDGNQWQERSKAARAGEIKIGDLPLRVERG